MEFSKKSRIVCEAIRCGNTTALPDLGPYYKGVHDGLLREGPDGRPVLARLQAGLTEVQYPEIRQLGFPDPHRLYHTPFVWVCGDARPVTPTREVWIRKLPDRSNIVEVEDLLFIRTPLIFEAPDITFFRSVLTGVLTRNYHGADYRNPHLMASLMSVYRSEQSTADVQEAIEIASGKLIGSAKFWQTLAENVSRRMNSIRSYRQLQIHMPIVGPADQDGGVTAEELLRTLDGPHLLLSNQTDAVIPVAFHAIIPAVLASAFYGFDLVPMVVLESQSEAEATGTTAPDGE